MTPFEDLSLLRMFARIVESGSISAAGRTLKVPQPTLSRHLRTLEERCGAALLRRDTHRLSMTEAGSRLLIDARAMLALADEATQRLQRDQTTLSGHLRIFATIEFGGMVVTRLIAKFLAAHPGLTVELGYTNRPQHMIQGGYDAGVVAGSITDESVVARPIGGVVRYLVATPGLIARYPTAHTPADVAGWPWLALTGAQFGGSKSLTLTSARKAAQTLRIAPIFISEGVTSLREAALAGLGVTILPDWLARDDLAARRLVRVLPQWNARELPVHVIYPAQRVLPARVRAFVQFAVGYMTRELRGKA